MNGLAWLDTLGPQRMRPGLKRTRALLDGLGSPERAFRSVLVAGTNGKGSSLRPESGRGSTHPRIWSG